MERIIRPYVNFDELKDSFKDICDSGIFTRGKYVSAFRDEIARFTDAGYAFTTSSCTTALWLALKVLGVGSGDDVAVSDFSFPATANVVEDLGANVRFVDVSLKTFNMLQSELTRVLTKQTKAVIYVDAFGNPSGILGIRQVCKDMGVPLIEDAACAFGSAINGLRCGNVADITCFSFHPRKLITTGEGGAITTNNCDIAGRLELKLNHGGKMQDNRLTFPDFGYNFRMSEFQAAVGLKQINKFDAIISSRQEAMKFYTDALATIGFTPQAVDDGVYHNVQSVVFNVARDVDRDGLIRHLYKHDIESTIGTYSLSNCDYYQWKYGQSLKNSRFLQDTTITLPCHETANIKHICDTILSYVR
ncbi:MAG: DegT/DnrJ/EryC1/StrS family aminotransferase [Nitrospirae bacterium]|nr:DegT/DnrJ/EryC1/StrS family aminotransferase [Nitrospirota bacterium]